MFSPIIRTTWLYSQYLVVFNQVAAGWRLGWVETYIYFRAMFSPIIRSSWLFSQYLLVFTQVAAGWRLGWVETYIHIFSGDVFAHHQEHLILFTVSGSTDPSSCWLVSWMSWSIHTYILNLSNTPASSYLGEYYQILWIQSSPPDDGRKHCPKHVEQTRNNKLTCIVASCWLHL